MKVIMTHDLACALEGLCREARRYGRPSREFIVATDLATRAVAFTIQLAIEAGRDPAEMRGLERDLISVLTEDKRFDQSADKK